MGERAEISAFLKTRRKAFLSLHGWRKASLFLPYRRKAFLSFHSRRKAILSLHSWLGDVQVCRAQLVQAIQRKVSAVTHSGGRSPQPRIYILSTRSISLLHSSSISLLHPNYANPARQRQSQVSSVRVARVFEASSLGRFEGRLRLVAERSQK